MNRGPYLPVDFSDCAVQRHTGYINDNRLNNGIVDVFGDRESCRAFCYSNHPSASFFTYVSSAHDDDKYKRTCWCQNTNEGKRPEGKQDLDGATSGEIKCGGMQKILQYLVTIGKCNTYYTVSACFQNLMCFASTQK